MSYFLIGIENTKSALNVGALWRSAHAFGASGIFTIGHRYKRQPADTSRAAGQIPLVHYDTLDDFLKHLPHDSRLVGVETNVGGQELPLYQHPKRAVYLLGAEDHGLSDEALFKCHDIIAIPSQLCLNVAVAGAIVMYDRELKKGSRLFSKEVSESA